MVSDAVTDAAYCWIRVPVTDGVGVGVGDEVGECVALAGTEALDEVDADAVKEALAEGAALEDAEPDSEPLAVMPSEALGSADKFCEALGLGEDADEAAGVMLRPAVGDAVADGDALGDGDGEGAGDDEGCATSAATSTGAGWPAANMSGVTGVDKPRQAVMSAATGRKGDAGELAFGSGPVPLPNTPPSDCTIFAPHVCDASAHCTEKTMVVDTAAAAAAAGCAAKDDGQASTCRRRRSGRNAGAEFAGSVGEKTKDVTLASAPEQLPWHEAEDVALVMTAPDGPTPDAFAAAIIAARSADATPPALLRRSSPDSPGMVSDAITVARNCWMAAPADADVDALASADADRLGVASIEGVGDRERPIEGDGDALLEGVVVAEVLAEGEFRLADEPVVLGDKCCENDGDGVALNDAEAALASALADSVSSGVDVPDCDDEGEADLVEKSDDVVEAPALAVMEPLVSTLGDMETDTLADVATVSETLAVALVESELETLADAETVAVTL
jgi:hypothetical protein